MDSIVAQMRSLTVFWKDLGYGGPAEITLNYLPLERWWDEDVEPWMRFAIKNDWNAHGSGVWFAEPRDAALFLTRFYGSMPNK